MLRQELDKSGHLASTVPQVLGWLFTPAQAGQPKGLPDKTCNNFLMWAFLKKVYKININLTLI